MSSQPDSEPDQRQPDAPLFTRAFVLLLVYQVTFGCGWSVFLLLPKFMTTELHATSHQIGLTVAIAGLGAVLGVPIAGPAFQRIGRTPMLKFGILVTALSAPLFTLVDRVGPLLFFLQALQGIGFVFAFNAAGTLAADLAPTARLGQAMGLFGASNIVTNALAPSMAEVVASRFDWNHVWWMSTGFIVVALGLASLLRDVPREDVATPPSWSDFDALLNPMQARMVLVSVLVGAAFCALFTFHQPFALRMGIQELRPFFIGFTCAAVFVRVALGSVGDRFGRQRVCVGALGLYGMAVTSMVLLQPDTLWVFGVLHGTAHGLFYPAGNALVVEHATPAQRGLVITAFNGGFHAGVSIGVYGFGWLAHALDYPAVFVVGGLLAFTGAVVTAQLRTTQHTAVAHP